MSATRVKMPIIKLCFSPFAIFVDNIKKFFLLGCYYSLVISAVSIALGFAYICNYMDFKQVAFYCSQSNVLFGIDIVVRFFLMSVFVVKYYEIVIKKSPISLKHISTIGKADIKTFAILVSFVLISMLPILSFALLYYRVPNPDWTIEITYFAVVSVGFLVPFILTRFYSALPYVIENGKLPSFKDLWVMTSGNGLRIISSLLFIFILFVFIVFQFYVSFYKAVDENPIYIGIISTFLYNLFMLLLISIGLNHCVVQKQILFGSDENE
ncbi:MAG: hypothetical protein LBL47_01445 [Lactobacillus sp.]|jgi:hypothetical protein|nr:hypothetical protein [Lactobacillus sp.]